MKILHVITSLRTGGAEKLLIDIIPRLKEEGHDVDLLLFDGMDTPFKEEAKRRGIKILETGNYRSCYDIRNLFKLLPIIKKYDIIHTHNTAPQLFVAIANLFCKRCIVTTEHNTTNRRREIKGLKWIDKLMYSQYKQIICISKKAEENLKQYLGKSSIQILTIENGIELSRFRSASASSELEEIAPGSKKIIMVAGFRNQKDQPTLIKSLKYLPEIFHLFLIGDGGRKEEFIELVKNENLSERVHFLGIRNDVPELLKASDYIVMSSHYEGLSLSSVEGMSSGKPFLASEVDGLREVVKNIGILFPHENSKFLAEEVLKLDSNPLYYAETVDNCLQKASQYDIAKTALEYLNLYERQ